MRENTQLTTLHITCKELFYAAMMLGIQQLVNVVYDFPADETKLNGELNEVKKELRRKKLLTESARSGFSLDFTLAMCALFCSEPESCEIVEANDYYATIYHAANMFMLLEYQPEDELAAIWFLKKESLNSYLSGKIEGGDDADGRS